MPIYWKRLLKITEQQHKEGFEEPIKEMRKPRKNEKCHYEVLVDGMVKASFLTVGLCDEWVEKNNIRGRLEYRRVNDSGL